MLAFSQRFDDKKTSACPSCYCRNKVLMVLGERRDLFPRQDPELSYSAERRVRSGYDLDKLNRANSDLEIAFGSTIFVFFVRFTKVKCKLRRKPKPIYLLASNDPRHEMLWLRHIFHTLVAPHYISPNKRDLNNHFFTAADKFQTRAKKCLSQLLRMRRFIQGVGKVEPKEAETNETNGTTGHHNVFINCSVKGLSTNAAFCNVDPCFSCFCVLSNTPHYPRYRSKFQSSNLPGSVFL